MKFYNQHMNSLKTISNYYSKTNNLLLEITDSQDFNL